VGKDVIANAIQNSSSRADGPFITVNCGAIPDSLLDSELFGHEKGAFTGALSQKKGRFERADGGTIFLDEIGELPLQAQVRMLRVLQNQEIERVGGSKAIKIDIRIIAATNQNLEQMANEGKFRMDLWFRLNVFPIHIPPLRDRKMDIPSLVQHFINRKSKKIYKSGHLALAPGAIDQLMEYDWPGNVRELENIIERALILNQGDPLSFSNLLKPFTEQKTVESSGQENKFLSLDKMISNHIRKALDMACGRIQGVGGAAELLDINANTLRSRMRKMGINK
jgi:transcriptional regulator with GAF, ATPase, and Fis domain